ncbi:MAG TPA: L17 family ribosomal protein, partial [Ignavibacteria bacterium]|nr:L17 family ribosomal protein [Ignavibacteria bacterium]
MVHRRKGRKFNRTASHRRALLANLSIALILNKRIKTTEAKAKELRRF